MKILHLIWDLGNGGAENMLVDIANEQSNYTNVSIAVINDVLESSIVNRISIKIKILLIKRKLKSFSPLFLIKLYWFILKNQIAVVHVHDQELYKYIILLPCRKVYTYHTLLLPIKDAKWYDKVFAISNSVKDDIIRRSNNSIVPAVILNGVDVQRIKQKSLLEIEKKSYKLIQVSGLKTEIKGQHLLIEALALIKKRADILFSIDFIGSGVSLDLLKSLVEENKLGNCVSFLGNKNREWIYENLGNYDLLIQPSILEGFGLSVVEAMAAKVPVLVSNIHGPMEIINYGKYGYCFDSNNIQNLYSRLLDILINYGNEDMIEKIKGAYSNVINMYDVKITARAYLESYC